MRLVADTMDSRKKKRKCPEDEEVTKLKAELKEAKDRLAAATPKCCICDSTAESPIETCNKHIACANCMDKFVRDDKPHKFKGFDCRTHDVFKCPTAGCDVIYGTRAAESSTDPFPHLTLGPCHPRLLGLCNPAVCRHCNSKLDVAEGRHVFRCREGRLPPLIK